MADKELEKAALNTGEKEHIYDLLYFGDAQEYGRAWKALRKAFPEAELHDASDYIHEHRLSFEANMSRRQYYKWLIREGMYVCSLGLQVEARLNSSLIEEIVSEMKKETNDA